MPGVKQLQLDIWGSCVSRDTVEEMPDAEPQEYVARQSAIVALCPAADIDVPVERLESDFQRRMLDGDRHANAGDRLGGSTAAAVLIDLVDERRGVWKFPDGSFLTNSVEAYHTGIDKWGRERNGRLIEFGSDEHFGLWKEGFQQVIATVRHRPDPILLLDIAWAEVFEGQDLPRGPKTSMGRVGRKVKRGAREMTRAISRGESLLSSAERLVAPSETRAEQLITHSRRANVETRRYVEVAESLVDVVIRRTVHEVRMSPDHRWGIGPYHYRDSDYCGIADDIRKVVEGRNPNGV